MIVERSNIPSNEAFDDSSYSLINEKTTHKESDKAVRLKLVDRIQTDDLSYSELRKHGLKAAMQSNRKVNEELFNYIESYF